MCNTPSVILVELTTIKSELDQLKQQAEVMKCLLRRIPKDLIFLPAISILHRQIRRESIVEKFPFN